MRRLELPDLPKANYGSGFAERWQKLGLLVAEAPPSRRSPWQDDAAHGKWLATRFAAWKKQRHAAIGAASVALGELLERDVVARVPGIALIALSSEARVNDTLAVVSPPSIRGNAELEDLARRQWIDRAWEQGVHSLLAGAEGPYGQCIGLAAKDARFAEWGAFCARRRAVVHTLMQRSRFPEGGLLRSGLPPGPDPQEPRECWGPQTSRLATGPGPASTAPKIALLLPDGAPLLTVEREKFRELLHAELVRKWSMPMLSLERTRALEQRHAADRLSEAARECTGPGLCETFADAEASVLLAITRVECEVHRCQVYVHVQGALPHGVRWPRAMAAEVKGDPIDFATYAKLVAALRAEPVLAADAGARSAESHRAWARLRGQLGFSTVKGYFGVWQVNDADAPFVGDAWDALQRCPVSAENPGLTVVLDVAADGRVRAAERGGDLRPLSRERDLTWQCVRDALRVLRFEPSADGPRRVTFDVGWPGSATPRRDEKYGSLDLRTRVRTRVSVLSAPTQLLELGDGVQTAPLEAMLATCYRKVFDERETRVFAVRAKITAPQHGQRRTVFELLNPSQTGPDGAVLLRCLEQAAPDLVWPCATKDGGTQLEALACMFGEASPARPH